MLEYIWGIKFIHGKVDKSELVKYDTTLLNPLYDV